jgi:penicillin-binding protein 1A
MRVLQTIFLTSIFFIATVFGVLFFIAHHHFVDLSVLANYNPGKPSLLLDDEGKEWGRFELDRREMVDLSAIPHHVQMAFIAAEDHNFFYHSGIAWKSILRSTMVNLYHRKIVQGASTITQQLVKLLFFDCKKTFKRKIKEQLLSLLVERQFTKEQILETYLNHVCFGCGIYGIEAAAKRFWNTTAAQLTIAQGAALAAIVKYPARFCPLVRPEITLKRRNIVLHSMKQISAISDVEYQYAKSEPLNLCEQRKEQIAPYLKESIRQLLEDRIGKHLLYTGGLRIQTTLDSRIQKKAEKAFKDQFEKLSVSLGNDINGALITLDGESGEVKALIGGCNYFDSQYNRALQARRQLGSIFKPIVYAVAMQQGRSFLDLELDEPVEFSFGGNLWQPQNTTRTFEGDMTLARALSVSNNIITVKTFLRAGAQSVINLAHKFHLSGEMAPYPSLALGCVDVSLKEAVAAFNVFAHDGMYVEPYFVKWVKNEWGSKIYRHKVEKERVLDSDVAGKVAKVLSIGMRRYLWRVKENNFKPEVIAKTGTTNDSRTCWFAGATARYTTALYIGRDGNSSLGKNIYPIPTIFPIWLLLYREVDNKPHRFKYDPSLEIKYINWKTGEEINKKASNAVAIYK